MIPLWLKILYTLMVCVIVPFYWRDYGPANFLWFSDVALLVLLPALWIENRLLFSMMAVGVLPLEVFWLVDFLAGGVLGITDYMFEADKPLYLRALSSFHFVLPPVMIYALVKLRYDTRALVLQTLLAWVVLPLSFLFSDPVENINWVFGPGDAQDLLPPWLYLILWMATLPVISYIPTHFLLKKIFLRQ